MLKHFRKLVNWRSEKQQKRNKNTFDIECVLRERFFPIHLFILFSLSIYFSLFAPILYLTSNFERTANRFWHTHTHTLTHRKLCWVQCFYLANSVTFKRMCPNTIERKTFHIMSKCVRKWWEEGGQEGMGKGRGLVDVYFIWYVLKISTAATQ